ncbi:hypothetical protein ATE48_18630 [Candidatus Viadribacter manganicus]|uniref:Uncharacterized protein n=1 Tax=Candidatus Viadribacter manganicus TaxID=1759059 RepID=A0A1B1AMG6_9PROT|nr:hypothetical protein ATE48_18630 [Candidatus Viadribacter manganicus]
MTNLTNVAAPFNPEGDCLPAIITGGGVTNASIASLLAALNSAAARRCKNRWARQRLHIATQAALDAAHCLERAVVASAREASHG